MGEVVVVAETGEGKLVNAVQAGGIVFRADEPPSAGGDGKGPGPFELLSAALGACTSMTLRLFAGRRGWKLDHIEVRVRHGRTGDGASLFVRDIMLDGELDEDQRRTLLEIAEKCPVHKTLAAGSKVVSGLVGRAAAPDGGEE
jgi:putative redox protein